MLRAQLQPCNDVGNEYKKILVDAVKEKLIFALSICMARGKEQYNSRIENKPTYVKRAAISKHSAL